MSIWEAPDQEGCGGGGVNMIKVKPSKIRSFGFGHFGALVFLKKYYSRRFTRGKLYFLGLNILRGLSNGSQPLFQGHQQLPENLSSAHEQI